MRNFLPCVVIVAVSFTGCATLDALTNPNSTPEERAAAQLELDNAVRMAGMIVPAPWGWVISIGGMVATALANGLFEHRPRPGTPSPPVPPT